MSAKQSWIIISLFCTLVFFWSLYRDIHAEKQYTADLRNRVVGARLQKDGQSPYFYKWKQGDGFRYYDPVNFNTLRVSNITTSPFFNYLLYPVTEWPQSRISIFWLIAEYVFFLAIVGLAFSLASVGLQQKMVVLTAGAFLLTEAWKMHISSGQNYIVIPLIAMIFYCCVRNRRSLVMSLIAGCAMVTLTLIRPTSVVFFLPFLFIWRTYSKQYLVLLTLPFICAGIWIGASSYRRVLWKDYGESLSQHVKLHQQLQPDYQVSDPNPRFAVWEGIDRAASRRLALSHPLHIFTENGNFFVVAAMFNVKINTRWLMIFSGASIVTLLFCFYRIHRSSGYSLPSIAVAGFCLYMLTDLFSPVVRFQYYTVQWLFPLLLAAAVYNYRLKRIYWWLLAGLLLNIANIPLFPMEHTIGEYIILAAFIVLSLQVRQMVEIEATGDNRKPGAEDLVL